MPLYGAAIRAAKPKQSGKLTLSDGGGLQLWVTATGSKLWNWAYHLGGKQTRVALGAWPSVRLKDARQLREEDKALLASGIDQLRARPHKNIPRPKENRPRLLLLRLDRNETHDRAARRFVNRLRSVVLLPLDEKV